jgi:surfeit locus 1 family protein
MVAAGSRDGEGRGRSRRTLVLVALAGALLTAFFASLGVWQVERLAWKTDLIARVEARLAAQPVPAPARDEWAAIERETHEYRRVSLDGRFLNDRETLVQAVTDLGPGFWVLTPFRRENGETVLVNRGFVPGDRRDPATRADALVEGATTVTGLLRLDEPGGAFLRENDPATDRWFSRDVAAIGAARGIEDPAPYFVDADRSADPSAYPVGGLTVVAFRNHHLIYAITWFALAAMVAGATAFVFLDDRRRRFARARLGEATG